ncbi:MAG: hypothetical protein HW383_231 [Candidatus Magasanikbacteria bacterium]|nr:hypothetical protein [Candidatus Magasanikbacteria bacterium]
MNSTYGRSPEAIFAAREDPARRDINLVAKRIAGELETARPKMEKFIGLKKGGYERPSYSRDAVNNDLRKVATQTAQFKDAHEKEVHAEAEALEKILFYFLEQNNWLGENARTIPTTRYDDYMNGIDSIIEWNRAGKSAAYLAIDFTVTETPQIVEKKIERALQELEKGTLARIKYFESESAPRGPLKVVPRVLIGVRRNALKDYASSAIDFFEKKTGSAKKIAEHPISRDIFDQVYLQLDFYAKRLREIIKEKDASSKKTLESKKEEGGPARADAHKRALLNVLRALQELEPVRRKLSEKATFEPSRFTEILSSRLVKSSVAA